MMQRRPSPVEGARRDDVREILGGLLRTAREDVDLTQRDVATRIGKSQSWVATSETGGRGVEMVELMEFARLYRKPLAFFFGPFSHSKDGSPRT